MGFQDDNSRLSFYDPLEVDSKPDHVHIEVLNVENGPSTTSYADSRFQFNHEHTEMMIELYKSHPELYDPFDPLYHHRKRKLECWREIAYKVSVRFNISPSAEDVKQKFRSLRTQYTCELKKERMNNGKGLNGRTFKSNWWCFNLLSFLSEINTRQEKIVSRFGLSSTVSEQNRAMDAAESSGVMSAESHAEDVLDINDVDFSCTPSLQESSDELEYHDDQSRDPTSTKKPQNTDSPDDDIRVFAQYVEAELRKIKVTKITKLKRNIINLIYDALDEDEN
nr:unnamed protein product [Callosobruchus chinensis]